MGSRIDENAFNKAWNNNVDSKLNAFVVRNIIENYEAARAPVSLINCAMALQGNERIKLGSDLQVIAKVVLDAAGVTYGD